MYSDSPAEGEAEFIVVGLGLEVLLADFEHATVVDRVEEGLQVLDALVFSVVVQGDGDGVGPSRPHVGLQVDEAPRLAGSHGDRSDEFAEKTGFEFAGVAPGTVPRGSDIACLAEPTCM
ncbi:MAG: hypothetical protein EBZ67_07605 [Chitinophagia bacterium]|nr:hypothetical protein [Chitinophagia bacterium]